MLPLQLPAHGKRKDCSSRDSGKSPKGKKRVTDTGCSCLLILIPSANGYAISSVLRYHFDSPPTLSKSGPQKLYTSPSETQHSRSTIDGRRTTFNKPHSSEDRFRRKRRPIRAPFEHDGSGFVGRRMDY